jgi:hypothetical protein
MRVLQIGRDHPLVKFVDPGWVVDEMWVEVVTSTLAGAPWSLSPHRTRTAGYPNQRAHPCAHQEHARTLAHSTDRNDAREVAHLARTGFFKPVHMKSLSAHALRSLIIGGEKTSGQRATLEGQIRGLAALLENTIRRFQSPAASK